MPRFFCDAIAGGKAVITGEDAAHIARSLRMQPGERLTLSDGHSRLFKKRERCRLFCVFWGSLAITRQAGYGILQWEKGKIA